MYNRLTLTQKGETHASFDRRRHLYPQLDRRTAGRHPQYGDLAPTSCPRRRGAGLFPELNLSGYIPSPFVAAQIAETVPGPSTEKIVRLAQRYQTTIAFGLIEREGDRLHCTHVLVNGDGLVGKQRKIHVPAQEQAAWSPGDAIEVFDLSKARVGITVCRGGWDNRVKQTIFIISS